MEYLAFIAQEKRNGQGKHPAEWKASEITEKWRKWKDVCFWRAQDLVGLTVLKNTVYRVNFMSTCWALPQQF